jgi:hypothetical protein
MQIQDYMNETFGLTFVNNLDDILDGLPDESYRDNTNVWTDGRLIYCDSREDAEDLADWIYLVLRNCWPSIGIGQFINDAFGKRSGCWYVEVV